VDIAYESINNLLLEPLCCTKHCNETRHPDWNPTAAWGRCTQSKTRSPGSTKTEFGFPSASLKICCNSGSWAV